MNILIINQPTNNRGDEAAHRSLVRELNRRFPSAKITIVFSSARQDSVDQMKVNAPQNTYLNIPTFYTIAFHIKRWGLRLGLIKLSALYPTHRSVVKQIKEADLIVCAPGGICMGLFQDWNHIYNLALAISYNKRVAYYSRSFGPFLDRTKWDKVFKKNSYNLLKEFDFLSIRDARTMQLADEIGLKYIAAIDTAFIDTPCAEIPIEIADIINSKEFVVFVPNSLTWHLAFKNCSESYLEKFYLAIIILLLTKYPNDNIIMLPQLFNVGQKGDMAYFLHLKQMANDNRIYVTSDQYSSDIQQSIISKAKLVIGARYHSIVFAINNEVPFVALSYEHKMLGLLQTLELQEFMFDIKDFGKQQPDISKAIDEIEKIIKKAHPCKEAKEKAKIISNECLYSFASQFKELLRKARI